MISSFLRAGREFAAYARQAALLPRDLAPDVPAEIAPGEHIAVFLHGVMASAGVLRPLRDAVEKDAGVRTASLSYPAGLGVAAIAERVMALCASLPSQTPLHLVGHSLGGVVMRAVAMQASSLNVIQTISLASPFAGFAGAGMLPSMFGGELDANGPLLRRLRMQPVATDVPHLSLVALEDHVVAPPLSHALACGAVEGISCGHNGILFDPHAKRLIWRAIQARAGAPFGGSPAKRR